MRPGHFASVSHFASFKALRSGMLARCGVWWWGFFSSTEPKQPHALLFENWRASVAVACCVVCFYLAGFDEFISSASWLAVMFIGGPVLKLLALHRHIGTMSQTLFLMNWNVLAMIAVSCPFLLAASRGFKWDSMIGELSYPIYLSHIFIYEVMAKFAPYSLVPSNFLYVCVTIAFSILLLWAVVLPVDRFRKNLA